LNLKLLFIVLAVGLEAPALSGQFDYKFSDRHEAAEPPISKENLPRTRTARKALALQLAAKYQKLSEREKRVLDSLGDDAFEPLFRQLLTTCAAYDSDSSSNASLALYEKYNALTASLAKVTSKNRTTEIALAEAKAKHGSTARSQLLMLLARIGDEQEIVPIFLKEVATKRPANPFGDWGTTAARNYVIRSKDPRAVHFMITQLKNPFSDLALREEAYWHLAGTGGKAGLRAVLSERHHRRLLRPIAERVLHGFLGSGEFGEALKILKVRTGPDGRVWGLLQSGVLGNEGDLWLAEKANGKWSNPLFTGVFGKTDSLLPIVKRLSPTFDGKTPEQLMAGAWFSLFVGNTELSKDSDHDGLTDLEEARLGTNPNEADTDGDGDSDAVDPWPNVSRQPQTNAEKVLATAFEARFHFSRSEGPAFFLGPKDMTPFEMVGRSGPTMWLTDGKTQAWATPLLECYESGVGEIGFQDMLEGSSKTWQERLIKWNEDHSQATVLISTYYSGVNGTGDTVKLQRFGSQWVVTSLDTTYVS